jgi:hypothetical protein
MARSNDVSVRGLRLALERGTRRSLLGSFHINACPEMGSNGVAPFHSNEAYR